MINKFTEKGIVQKIIVVLIFLVVFNFVYPYVPAYGADALESVGGVLLEPLINLITSLGEGIIWVIQSMLLGLPASNIHIQKEGATAFWAGLAAGAATIVGLILAPVTLGASAVLVAGAIVGVSVGVITSKMLPDDWYFPVYKISPQEIFADQVPALHINFINPKTYDEEDQVKSSDSNKLEYTKKEDHSAPVFNSAKVLAPQISKWYTAIRNMVLVGLMVVLLYIGIRIVLSSTAGEKAKYKEHIKDWLVAVILVVFMHYIMAFALTITEYLTSMLNSNNEMIKFQIQDKDAMKQIFGDEDYSQYKEGDNYNLYVNLMGYARLKQQLNALDSKGNVIVNWDYIGYAIIYMALVIYTVMFLVIYLKRVIYMAFLTMIAPLVALTYPIDKISDGKAQAFDMWLKEYSYNLLLQPFHLLLYTMLIGSVMDLAANNMLYALVALGFLIPAEQLLRKFFGFEKSAIAGNIVGGMVGGSLAMNALHKLGRIGPPPPPKGIGKGQEKDDNKINFADREADTKQSNDDLYSDAFGGATGNNNVAEASSNGSGEDGTTVRFNGQQPTAEESLPSGYAQGENETVRFNDQQPDSEESLPSGYTQRESGLYVPYNEPIEIESGNEQDKFDADSNYEFKTPRLVTWASNKVENGKDGIEDRLNNTRGRISDWAAKTPKTRLGRNAKRFVIRGAKGTGAIAQTAAHYTGKALTSVGRKVPRMVAKATVATAMGTVGVAAGLASGNLNNAFTYGAAAAKIGSNLGDTATTATENLTKSAMQSSENVRQTYMENRYSKDELKQKKNEELDRAWRKDKDTINKYKEKFGSDREENGNRAWENAMDNALEYRRKGITDDKAIMAAMKLDGLADSSKTSKERMALAKAASTVKSDKEVKAYGERLSELGISDDKIKQVKSNIRKMNKM